MTNTARTIRLGVTIVFLSTMALTGCASTGGLESRANPIDPASLHAQQSLSNIAQNANAWPNRNWWQTAGDTQLNTLVHNALTHNPTMTLVQARVRMALAAAGATDAQRQPTLSVAGKIAGNRLPPILPPIANGHFHKIRLGYLSFNWAPDIWGGKRAAWQAAVGKARAAQVDAQAARLKLAAHVVHAYFDLAGAYRLHHLARAELQRAHDFLELTQQRVRKGVDTRFSLERIQSEMAADQVRVAATDHAVTKAKLVLASLLGKGPDFAQTIKKPLLPTIPALAIPDDLPANLLGRRPDVVAARWRVQAANSNVTAAQKAFLPNISISSLIGLLAPTSQNLFSSDNRFYTVSPALALPIFEGGKLRANLASNDAARDIAVAKYNQTLIHAINQVATQADTLRSLNVEAKSAAAAKHHAKQAYRLSLKRYHAGVGSYLESLTVRRQLISAEQTLVKIQQRRCDAWATLNLALGGGFTPSKDAPRLTSNHNTSSQSLVNQ